MDKACIYDIHLLELVRHSDAVTKLALDMDCPVEEVQKSIRRLIIKMGLEWMGIDFVDLRESDGGLGQIHP